MRRLLIVLAVVSLSISAMGVAQCHPPITQIGMPPGYELPKNEPIEFCVMHEDGTMVCTMR